jgi:hypothetical protein
VNKVSTEEFMNKSHLILKINAYILMLAIYWYVYVDATHGMAEAKQACQWPRMHRNIIQLYVQ